MAETYFNPLDSASSASHAHFADLAQDLVRAHDAWFPSYVVVLDVSTNAMYASKGVCGVRSGLNSDEIQ